VGLDVCAGHSGSQQGGEDLGRGEDLPGLDEGERFFRVGGRGLKDGRGQDGIIFDDVF